MSKGQAYPTIRHVEPQSGRTIRVTFENGIQKAYDCTPLLKSEPFRPLQDDAIFRCVHTDTHGYGIVWNDKIDIAESEIWINGRNVEQSAASDANKPRA